MRRGKDDYQARLKRIALVLGFKPTGVLQLLNKKRYWALDGCVGGPWPLPYTRVSAVTGLPTAEEAMAAIERLHDREIRKLKREERKAAVSLGLAPPPKKRVVAKKVVKAELEGMMRAQFPGVAIVNLTPGGIS